eukprot:jgi/Orpsp1_1/1192316/evm.model.d7180000092210.1
MGVKAKASRYAISTLSKRLGATKELELVETYCDEALTSLGTKLGETIVNGRKTFKSLDQVFITMEQFKDELVALGYWDTIKNTWDII